LSLAHNAQGGTLVIGKNDRGVVVGVANAAKLLEDIPNKVRDILGIVVVVNLHSTKAGLDWLAIEVDAYPSPISYRGEYHLRSGSTKQELKGAALDRFLLRKLGRHWDGVPVPHVGLADLDPAAFKAFRKPAGVSGLLAKHPSQPTNPDIAKTLFLAGKIESWGRRIDLIRHACTAHGSPVPRFECDSTGFGVEFGFAAPLEGEKASVETSVETPVEILTRLQANPNMTLAELAVEIKRTLRTVELASAKLIKEGKLKRVGPRKGGHWEIVK
jgi:predicted HTH transcriptional regulator